MNLGPARILRGLAAVAAAALLLLAPPSAEAQRQLQTFETDSLTIETMQGARHAFSVELAKTLDQKAQGLMFRKSLPADAGMLFFFEPAQQVGFWMQNTAIPLDILFVAEGGRIDQIVERTVPFSTASIISRNPVVAVLELNAGTAKRLGIAPGDRILYPGL